ncbi:unnamed protein product [Citrullus colocynthis]|uniref:Uncharacterized protein n=1 Tax=Citrullus colocynthis TaxID=252529 RepID=A0ABP0Z615_9ROSI
MVLGIFLKFFYWPTNFLPTPSKTPSRPPWQFLRRGLFPPLPSPFPSLSLFKQKISPNFQIPKLKSFRDPKKRKKERTEERITLMGNCCRSQSSTMIFSGDDWGSFSSKHSRGCGGNATTSGGDPEKHRLLGGKEAASCAQPQVKIKMTKRELEDLEMQGLSLEQVIGRLVNDEDEFDVEHHRSWRPSLQSIPEDY